MKEKLGKVLNWIIEKSEDVKWYHFWNSFSGFRGGVLMGSVLFVLVMVVFLFYKLWA